MSMLTLALTLPLPPTEAALWPLPLPPPLLVLAVLPPRLPGLMSRESRNCESAACDCDWALRLSRRRSSLILSFNRRPPLDEPRPAVSKRLLFRLSMIDLTSAYSFFVLTFR